MELDIHLLRDKVAAGVIFLQDVPSHDLLADILAKPLSQQFFVQLKHKLGVKRMLDVNISSSIKWNSLS